MQRQMSVNIIFSRFLFFSFLFFAFLIVLTVFVEIQIHILSLLTVFSTWSHSNATDSSVHGRVQTTKNPAPDLPLWSLTYMLPELEGTVTKLAGVGSRYHTFVASSK